MLIADFPGTNSLEHHAKTFSICGAMSNFIVLVIPYTGDMNTLISEETSKVFGVMAGSESTQILLCINKCGYELPKALQSEIPLLAQQEKKGDQEPIDYLREKFASKLNEHYENTGKAFRIEKEHILFTDWMASKDEEIAKCGIVGVDSVKEELKKYIVKHSILNAAEIEEVFGLLPKK